MTRILLADDNKSLRELYRQQFSDDGYEVITACNGVEAYNLYLETSPDIVMTDFHMPEMNGLDFALVLRRLGYDTPVILISGGNTYIHGYLDNVIILRKPTSHQKLSLILQGLIAAEA